MCGATAEMSLGAGHSLLVDASRRFLVPGNTSVSLKDVHLCHDFAKENRSKESRILHEVRRVELIAQTLWNTGYCSLVEGID